MESNELKIFMAVAQEGSITKAAQRSGIPTGADGFPVILERE